MKKRLLAILLTLAMVLSLAACGGKKEEAPKEESNAPSTEEKTEAPAGAPIKVGVYMCLTGANAASGQAMLEGMEQARDEINGAGGVAGREIEFVTYDTAGTSEGATKAATRLIEEDGVIALSGDFNSASALAVSEISEKAKIVHMNSGTALSWTNIGLDYTYRGTARGDLPLNTMFDMMEECGDSSIALISVASEYGQGGRESILSISAERGIDVLADVVYQSADTDFTGHISQLLAAKADTVVIYGLGFEIAMITKQLRQNGYTDLIYTIEGGANAEMLAVARGFSDGVVFSATYVIPATLEEAATDTIRNILAPYYEKNGEMPFGDAFYRGYDQIYCIAEALKNAEDPDNGESVMKAFKQIKGLELAGGTFDFTDGSGDGLFATSRFMILDEAIKEFNLDAIMAWREANA